MVDWGCVMAMTEEERKQRQKEAAKKYRDNNPEKEKARTQEWRAKNSEKINATI
jgi:very-short-patch-repair endonuclease